jgi:hypothetical protein
VFVHGFPVSVVVCPLLKLAAEIVVDIVRQQTHAMKRPKMMNVDVTNQKAYM